jgi:hypothetical protein
VPNSPTAPTSAELSQVNKDRYNTVAYVIQALKDERELVDKSMSRLSIDKLRDDYSRVREKNDLLMGLVSISITAGNDPSADYSGLRQTMSELHWKAVDLQAYVTGVSPARRSGEYVVAGSNDPTYKYYIELPSGTIVSIWNDWQLRQETQRARAQKDVLAATLPPFKTLFNTFGP